MRYLKAGENREAEVLVNEDLKIQTELLGGKRSKGAWGGEAYVQPAGTIFLCATATRIAAPAG
jgi:hypothetical protein